MNCSNCQSIIADIDDVRFAPEDIWSEYPMCSECAPDFWRTEAEYWDDAIDDKWEEWDEE